MSTCHVIGILLAELCQCDVLKTQRTRIIGFNFQYQHEWVVKFEQEKKCRFYSLITIQTIFDTPHMENSNEFLSCESENHF